MTSWRLRVDVESKKKLLSKRFTVSWGWDSLGISNCGLFMIFLCSFTFYFSLLIYLLMILRTPKNDTNELISYSFGERERFMVIALLDSKKTKLKWTEIWLKRAQKKKLKNIQIQSNLSEKKKCCEIIHQMRLQFVVWVLFAYFTPGGICYSFGSV